MPDSLDSWSNRLLIHLIPQTSKRVFGKLSMQRNSLSFFAFASMFVGLVAIIFGTFCPYVRIVFTSNYGSQIFERNAWQFGSHLSITPSGGPLIVLFAGIMIFGQFALLRDNSRRSLGQRFFAVFANLGLELAFVIQIWPGSWVKASDAQYFRGYGGVVSVFGVLLCAVGTTIQYLQFRDTRRSSR